MAQEKSSLPKAGNFDGAAHGGSAGLRVVRMTDLPPGFGELAADALGDGVRLLEVLREDWLSGKLRFNQHGEALFAAMTAQAALLGVCGLTADPYAKVAFVGRVRRLYVLRAARSYGVGRALLDKVCWAARASGYERLRVRAPVSAFAFYERCQFLRAVGESGATHLRRI